MVLKELIFHSFYTESMCGLERTDYSVSTLGWCVSLTRTDF